MFATPPTSLTSRERRNPPPRQKSCAACIRAKRRCEPGGGVTSTCSRCEQRGLTCELPVRRTRRTAATSPAPSAQYVDYTPMPSTSTSLPVDGCVSLEDGLFQLDPLFGAWDTSIAASPLGVDAAPPLGGNFSLADLRDPTPLPLVHQPPMPVSQPARKEWDPLPEFARRRLQYPIDQIKKVPALFVTEGQTPWCHGRLYEDEIPKCVQDVLSCCALSLHLNPLSAPLITRTITSHIQTLLQAPEPSTTLEILAHTHSLLLYHILLIFTPDISLRSLTERTQSALEDAAMSLLPHINFDIAAQHPDDELPYYPLAPTMAFWRDWILQESGRRTLLFTFFLLQAYRIIAGKPIDACDGRLGMCHSFTLSSRLWHAGSAVEFAKAWGRDRHLVVENGKLEVAFREANAGDVDVFGRILLTSIMGVDEAEGWFASRGGSLFTKADGFV